MVETVVAHFVTAAQHRLNQPGIFFYLASHDKEGRMSLKLLEQSQNFRGIKGGGAIVESEGHRMPGGRPGPDGHRLPPFNRTGQPGNHNEQDYQPPGDAQVENSLYTNTMTMNNINCNIISHFAPFKIQICLNNTLLAGKAFFALR